MKRRKRRRRRRKKRRKQGIVGSGKTEAVKLQRIVAYSGLHDPLASNKSLPEIPAGARSSSKQKIHRIKLEGGGEKSGQFNYAFLRDVLRNVTRAKKKKKVQSKPSFKKSFPRAFRHYSLTKANSNIRWIFFSFSFFLSNRKFPKRLILEPRKTSL